MTPIITERAASDILEIFDFYSESSAQRIVDAIVFGIGDLEIFPLYGRARDELKRGLRSFVVHKYVVFYSIVQEVPVVIRVLHGSRDIESIFQPEDEV